jgi:formate/nitrite transporter FocA (FNT family)
MLGLYSSHAQTYLLVLAIATTAVFALPIFLCPLAWARLMRWRIPDDIDLTVYFGRCLGAFILIVEALMLRAALTGEALFMIAVHLHGAVRRIQPWTETLEIGFYCGLLACTLLFWPVPT